MRNIFSPLPTLLLFPSLHRVGVLIIQLSSFPCTYSNESKGSNARGFRYANLSDIARSICEYKARPFLILSAHTSKELTASPHTFFDNVSVDTINIRCDILSYHITYIKTFSYVFSVFH